MDTLDAVATRVAQSTAVQRLEIETEQSLDAIGRRLYRPGAVHGAGGARRFGGREVPRAGAEAVLRRGERPDRADLHRVAGEIRVERLLFEVQDLRAVATVDEGAERITRDLVRIPSAPRTLNTAHTIQQDQFAERDRLLEVALLLDEARLSGPERERLVLERTLAAPVADRTVEWMVDEQELENTVLHLLHRVGLRAA